MICGRCPEGRRFATGSTYCVLYGIIISDTHKCTLEGGKRHDSDGAADHGEVVGEEAELQKDGSGIAGTVP